jgi:hypothetical protein
VILSICSTPLHDPSTYLLASVTITSVLRVTAVANSVHNQQDQTWNFIQRGIWTLIEANLGIICACLIVLKRFFATMFGASKTTNPTGGYGYGSSGAAGHTDSSGKRDRRSQQQHFQLDDSVDDDEPLPQRRSYRMDPLADRGGSLYSRRGSDERHIISVTHDVKREYSQSTVESVDRVAGWSSKPDAESGIMKKVDVQVESYPAPSINER